MQRPPDISTALYNALALIDPRLNVLVELYPSATTPGVNGFDPANAILRVANKTTTFLSLSYTRYVQGVSRVNRTITEKFNTVSVNLDNADKTIAAFVINNPLEGLLMVVRLVSRAVTVASILDSFVIFTGKCEKTFDAKWETVTISAKQYLGSTDEETPKRVYGPEDEEGRVATDPLFEGFQFKTINIVRQYQERVPRGSFLGRLFGLKKTVTRTIQYTSHTDAKPEEVVPLLLGRGQVVLKALSYVDLGENVYSIFSACEGPIKDWHDLKVLTPGFQPSPQGLYLRFGYPGGTNDQLPIPSPDAANYAGNGYYSKTAWIAFFVKGSKVSEEDPAPDAVAVLWGMIIPIPDSAGNFTVEDAIDNPAYQTRWLLTDANHGFNLNANFINDPVCVDTGCYCDHPVLDLTDGDRVYMPDAVQTGPNGYGTWWWRYYSTGILKPIYYRYYYLSEAFDPPPELRTAVPTFYAQNTTPSQTVIPRVRRRFTSNIYLTEKMKKVDFLFKILLPTFRGYITQNARGKLDIKAKRPGDNTVIRTASLVGATEIAVNDVTPWVSNLNGHVVIGVDLATTSEVRAVSSYRYTTAANSITLAVTGNLTRSGPTLTGGTDGPPGTPATGSVTVTGLGTLTVTIDGRSVSYTTESASSIPQSDVGDTTSSAAAMLCAFLKADTVFASYLKFTWNPSTPTVISIQSKIGFLVLSSPALQHAHGLSEQALRVEMTFAEKLFVPTDITASNILRDSVRWPIGSRQASTNRIDSTFIDSPQDFRNQQLRTRNSAHITQTKKVLPRELNLTGVDNYNQAKRLQANLLAELRDLDFFMQHSSDRRALLLEEGDLICNTHGSGGFRNLVLRVEEISINPSDMSVDIVARRYATSAYSDDAAARVVPLPSTISQATTGPPAISFNTTDFPPSGLIQTTASEGITSVRGGVIFGASIFSQEARVSLKRPGETSFTQIAVVQPDANLKATFEFIASEEGTYTVQLEVCFPSGLCNATKPTATITVSFGALGALLTEAAGTLLTEGGDFLALG